MSRGLWLTKVSMVAMKSGLPTVGKEKSPGDCTMRILYDRFEKVQMNGVDSHKKV